MAGNRSDMAFTVVSEGLPVSILLRLVAPCSRQRNRLCKLLFEALTEKPELGEKLAVEDAAASAVRCPGGSATTYSRRRHLAARAQDGGARRRLVTPHAVGLVSTDHADIFVSK